MVIERPAYLSKLVSLMWNGQAKVITGIRRCGKSYLLKKIFKEYLVNAKGVPSENILVIELDDIVNAHLRNPLELSRHVRNWAAEKRGEKYLFIDEIQMSAKVPNPSVPTADPITFYDALNSFLHLVDLDVYVTGSNSKMLSSDILTEFRGRGDEIRLHPLSFSEYYAAMGGDRRAAFDRYARFGGMPFTLSRPNDASVEAYLKSLFEEVYLKDIIERKHVERADVLGKIIDFIGSGIGSLTNPNKIANSLSAADGSGVSSFTVSEYMNHLKDAFLVSEARRYDVKGRSYFDYPNKYYFEDIGLRNARTSFRQQELTHIMENIVYNDLIRRGYSVDVGVVFARENNKNGNSVRVAREIDFVVNKAGERIYIQSAYALPDEEKRLAELKPFSLTGDSFRKIVIRTDVGLKWFDENGILNLNLLDFLLDEAAV